MLDSIRKYIKKADIFGVKPELFIQRKKLFRTLNGGILTILLFTCFAAIGSFQFMNYVNGERMTLFEREKFNENLGSVRLGRTEFIFAFGFKNVTLNEIYLKNRFLDIRVFYRENLRNFNDSKVFRRTDTISIVKCNESFFPEQIEDFQRLGLDQYLCPEFGEELFLDGTYISDIFKFIRIDIDKCKGTDCMLEKESLKILQATNDIEIEFFVTTKEFSLDSDKNSLFKKKIVSEIHFPIDSSGYLKRSADIFIRENIFSSDSDFETDLIHGFSFKNEIKETINISSGDDNPWATFYFRKSLYTTFTYRSFWKFGDLVSYLGGLWNPVFLICLWLGRKFNQKSCLIKLANNLYSFISKDIDGTREKEQVLDTQRKITQNTPKCGEHIEKNLKHFLKQKSRSISLSVWQFYRKQFFPCLRRRKDEKIIKSAFKKLATDLDIFAIIKNLQEFQKLKQILFDSTQINLFNFIPKPNILEDMEFKKIDHIYSLNQLTKQRKIMKEFLNRRKLRESTTDCKHSGKEKRRSFKRSLGRVLDDNTFIYEEFKDYLKILKQYKLLKTHTIGTEKRNINIPCFISQKLVTIFDQEIQNLRKHLNLTDTELEDWIQEIPFNDSIAFSSKLEPTSSTEIPTERLGIPPHFLPAGFNVENNFY